MKLDKKDLHGLPLEYGDTVIVVWRRASHHNKRPEVVAGIIVPASPSGIRDCVFNYGIYGSGVQSFIFIDDEIDLVYVSSQPEVIDKYGNPLSLGDFIKYDHANLKFEGVLQIGLDAFCVPYFYVERKSDAGRTVETRIHSGEDLEVILI